MTEKGVIKTLKIISGNFPNYHPDYSITIPLWQSAFEKFGDQTVQDAVKKYIYTDISGFAPTIGKIVHIIFSEGKEVMSEVEAWGYVSKALRNSLYGAEGEFAKLPETVRNTIGSADRLKEWAALDEREVQTVISSNFMRSYRARTQGGELQGIEMDGQRWIEG